MDFFNQFSETQQIILVIFFFVSLAFFSWDEYLKYKVFKKKLWENWWEE
jgi:hypothetical protein